MKVRLEITPPGIARIVIDNPDHRNALTFEMWKELSRAAGTIRADPAVRVVVVRGAGTACFSSGADISEFLELRSDPAATAEYDATIEAAMRAIADIGVPVIAQIHGTCIGGGVALALMCDLRYMEAGGAIGIPAGKLGIAYHPDWIRQLVHVVGPTAASEIFFTAGRHSAERAAAWGFCNEVATEGTLETRVQEVAERVASLAPMSLRAAKVAIRESPGFDAARGWGDALRLARACDSSRDYRRGIDAYRSHQKPRFEGN